MSPLFVVRLLVLGSCGFVSPVLHAQVDSTLAVGTRFRLVVGRARPDVITGTLAGRADRALLLDTDTGRVAVPIEAVRRLWVSRGRKTSHPVIGAAIGGLAGFLAGAVLGAATAPDCPEQGWDALGCELGSVDHSAAFAGGGLLFGAAAGLVIAGGGERWEAVPVAALHPSR